ncbi:hypothetical protein GYA93_08350 [Gordonia desulfuricans]|uniref:Uncharacterized protein n=1 Tax=Gordonia desulfuricans TaxID=89051 RepID=A0A7K3LMV6_9ACTN|nr:hypothetical protein [Gordonia desulfuricans]NDK89586.1 hypothetical protein [Gordonia desulfuricans]
MTDPTDPTDRSDPEHIPTQAELDAEDFAQLQRRSRDKDEANLYPGRPADPGPAPTALAVHARVAWWGSAIAGLVVWVYGIVDRSAIGDMLRSRMLTDAVAAPKGQPTDGQIDTYAAVLPVVALVVMVVLPIGEYLFLVAAASRHSRNCRNFFLTIVVVHLLCIPVGIDLFFDYPGLWSGAAVLGWLQFALLIVAGVMTLRRVVDRWLPESTRMRPSRMLRAR